MILCPIHEFNPEHEPAGTPIGGQFASKKGPGPTVVAPSQEWYDVYQKRVKSLIKNGYFKTEAEAAQQAASDANQESGDSVQFPIDPVSGAVRLFTVRPPSTTDLRQPATNWPLATNEARTLVPPKALQTYTDRWVQGLSPEESAALQLYTEKGSDAINSGLWHRTVLNPQQQTEVDRIQRSLERGPTPPPPALVWRGVSEEGAAKILGAKVGDEVRLDGLQSASVNPVVPYGLYKYMLEIVPKSGAYIASISAHRHAEAEQQEYEFLMPHGRTYTLRGVAVVTIDTGRGKLKQRVLQLEMN